MADDRNLENENDLLREQIRLLQEANRLQRESFDISSSAVDSLKEAMGINSRRSTFESSILKINKQVAQAILDQKTGLRDVESINKQISKNQDLLNKSKRIEESIEEELSSQSKDKINSILDVYNLQQKYTQEIENGNLEYEKELSSLDFILESQLKSLSYREKLLLATKQITQELEMQNQLREGEKNVEKNLQEQLGLAGKIAKTLSHFKGIADDVNEALEDTKKKYRDIAESGGELPGKWQTFSTLIGKTFTNLAKNIGDPLVAITTLFKVLKDVDSSAGDFAKSMNITYSQALDVREEMSTIASLSGDVALNSKNLQESLLAINQSLGTNGKISEQDLVTFTKLREQSGLTNEQLVSMQKYSMATGGALKDNVEKFQATSKILSYQNKVALNTKQLMVDMGAVSNRVKLSIEGGAEGLAKAAFNAKLMGGDLEKVSAIADQLLNFESSIEAELSAELLTGKDLTLEKARQAALNNDLATVASEITNQMGSAKDFANSNRIQQEAIAKAVGMSADQLGDMLFEQEALRKVGRKLSDDEQRAFDLAKEKYSVEEASRMLREGQLDQMVEQQSIQDRFNQSVLKLQEIFVSLAEPILQIVSPIADMVGWLASIPGLLKTIAAGFMVIKGIQVATYAVQLATTHQKMIQGSLDAREIMMGKTKIAQLVAQATAWALMNPIGAAIGAAAAVGIGALIYSSMKDGVIDPKKGPILSGEFGSVQLNPRDKAMYDADGRIKVGTNLTGNPSSSTQDNSALIAEIRAMRNELNNRPVVVHSVVKTENNDVLARGTNSANRKSYSIQ